jgi:hypothetical protein
MGKPVYADKTGNEDGGASAIYISAYNLRTVSVSDKAKPGRQRNPQRGEGGAGEGGEAWLYDLVGGH